MRIHAHRPPSSKGIAAARPPSKPAPKLQLDAFESSSKPRLAGALAVGGGGGATPGVPVSPYYVGALHAEGSTLVGQDGQALTWHGVSEFELPHYLNDPTKPPEQRDATVAQRLDERVTEGFSVVRVFGTLDWAQPPLHPFDDWESYKANTEKLFQMAKDRGLYVEFTAFTDSDKTVPANRRNEYVDWLAEMGKRYDNVLVEVANESFKNGLSKQDVYDLGNRFRQSNGTTMLAGSSPTGDGVDGTDDGGVTFGRSPFTYVTLHPERTDGDGGFRWVRHLREGQGVADQLHMPVVQDEPIGSAETSEPGRRDSNPQHFRDAAIVAAITGQGFTFHTQRAVTEDPNAQMAEPGVDQVHLSDLVPQDQRGFHFVNGQWPDAPFDVGDQFEKNVLRVFTKMKNDGSGFYTYPVDVMRDTDLKLKNGTHLVVVDVATQQRLVDRDFASGEVLHLPAGSDVLIYGGNVQVPELKQPTPATPPVPGAGELVPAQRPLPPTAGPKLSDAAADEATHRLYRAVFGREPDPSGLESVGASFRDGNYDNPATAMSSEEFDNRRASLGLTSGKAAVELFKGLLGRAPTQDELANAVNQLNAGDGAKLMSRLLTSPEFQAAVNGQPAPGNGGPVGVDPLPPQLPADRNRARTFGSDEANQIVTRLYRALLGRDPDLLGMQTWPSMVAGGRLADVVNGIVLSEEFKARMGGLTAQGLTQQLYADLLDRNPDDMGRADTEAQITAGNLANRTVGIVLSDEFRANNG